MIFDDGFVLPLSDLSGIKNADDSEFDWIFHYNFSVKDIFEKSLGKYSSVFGNVAFIDCGYVYQTLVNSIASEIKCEWFEKESRCLATKASLDRISEWLESSGASFCDFAFEMDGCLKEQASFYVDDFKSITSGIAK